MRKSRHIALSVTSLLVALILLYHGISYQGVMMSIVGAALLLQGLAIIATPLSENTSSEEEFYRKIIMSYASNMEKLLISATGSQAFYVPFKDKVRVVIASNTPRDTFKIDILLDVIGDDLVEKLERDLNLTDELEIEKVLSRLNDMLKEKGLIEELEYNITDKSLILEIKKPVTLKLHEDLSSIAPKTYSYLGCPLTSAIIVLVVKMLGETFTTNFKLEDDIVKVLLKSVNLGFTRVVQNDKRVLA